MRSTATPAKRQVPVSPVMAGIPAGLQASMFAISNTLIHSSINIFGSAAVAGQTAALNIEHFITTPVGSFAQAAQSFTSQNYGARKTERFAPIARCSVLITAVAGFSICALAVIFAKPLVSIYTTDFDKVNPRFASPPQTRQINSVDHAFNKVL